MRLRGRARRIRGRGVIARGMRARDGRGIRPRGGRGMRARGGARGRAMGMRARGTVRGRKPIPLGTIRQSDQSGSSSSDDHVPIVTDKGNYILIFDFFFVIK